MSGENYYMLSTLPALGGLGTKPPVTSREVMEYIGNQSGVCDLLGAVFLSDDILQSQAWLAGEIESLELAVLSPAQAKNEEPLPSFLVSDQQASSDNSGRTLSGVDVLWENYYFYVAGLAAKKHSHFLRLWVGYEVGLRNALTRIRAQELHLEYQDYVVAEKLANDTNDFTHTITQWSSAPDPFSGLRVLDQARWRWLLDNDSWYSFSDDELVAYAVKLMLLNRWHRIETSQLKMVDDKIGDDT